MVEKDFDAGFGGAFLRLAKGLGIVGADSIECGVGLSPFSFGIEGAAPKGAPGTGGARFDGRVGADGLEVSESECAESAPVEMPPLVFLSVGIPPAKSPPSCGAAPMLLSPAVLPP